MQQITPADYQPCPGSGAPVALITNQTLRVGVCSACGRKVGYTVGKLLARRHAESEWRKG